MKVLDRLSAENARTYALRVLQYNIINLELVPGSTVSENELSAILNLSRTPVREALIELSKVGLVEIQPQRGAGECRVKAGLRRYFTGIYGQTKRKSQDGGQYTEKRERRTAL